LLICGECGRNYRRVRRASGEIVWRCANRVEHGNRICKGSLTVAESELLAFMCDALNMSRYDPQTVKNAVGSICVDSSGELRLEHKDFAREFVQKMI
jgi:hypothetical protein